MSAWLGQASISMAYQDTKEETSIGLYMVNIAKVANTETYYVHTKG
jgi:hypothetical protein